MILFLWCTLNKPFKYKSPLYSFTEVEYREEDSNILSRMVSGTTAFLGTSDMIFSALSDTGRKQTTCQIIALNMT